MTSPVPTGYYGGMPASGLYGTNPYYPVRTPGMLVNPSGGVGIPNPNEADGGWYATNLGGNGMEAVTGDQYRTLTDSTHSNRELLQSAARIAALIYGGGALTGSLGTAGLGFGGGAAAGAGEVASGYGISPGFVGGGEAGLGAGSVPAAGAITPALAAGEGTVAGSLTAGADTLGAAAGGLGASLSGLGLPGWLTVGSLAAGALQGNKDQTTTTTNAPPAYIAPYLSQAAGAAADQYGKGAYVSPLQQAAVGYGTNVLNGSYLNSNPYLDATFNRAAGAVTNQVQSNFGLAGRNPRGPDAAGLATDKYSELATQIYGQNYQDERNRQQQILPMTNQLGTIGNPSTALDDYIARLRNLGGGYGSNTSTTPTQSNLYSGLAGLGLALIPGG